MLNREFIQKLTPVEVEFLSGYIASLLKEKVTDDLDNHVNLDGNLKYCPKCGSIHFVKNGFNPNHRQKYRCKDCNSVFLSSNFLLFVVVLLLLIQYFYLQLVLFFHAAD